MPITVYGKPACGLCEAAKKKLVLMGLSYSYEDITDEYPKDWRESGIVEALSWHMIWETLPVIRIGAVFYNYPNAMKELKRRRKQKGSD